MSRVLVCALLLSACASPPTRDDVLQSAINAGKLACEAALADPATQWGPGAEAYCQAVVNGCPKP